jgi:hypothetical protein
MTVAAIARTAEATVAAAATLSTRVASPALALLLQSLDWDHQHEPWFDTQGEATPPSTAAGSHRYAWPNHGRPSIHTTLGVDLGSVVDVRCPAAASYISILDVLAWLMGLAVTGQLLQHNDALDATIIYGVSHRLRCVESHHA